MGVVIIEMSEMCDSKELYNYKPPAACIAFLYTIFALCIVIAIWVAKGEINIVIKSNATVKTYENSNARLLEEECECWIEIPVSTCDIQCIENGMAVRCSLEALPSSEYGYVEGHIIDISSQLYIDDNGQGYYIVKACPNSTKLTGSNGKDVALQNHMVGTVVIRAGKQSVLEYLKKFMQ